MLPVTVIESPNTPAIPPAVLVIPVTLGLAEATVPPLPPLPPEPLSFVSVVAVPVGLGTVEAVATAVATAVGATVDVVGGVVGVDVPVDDTGVGVATAVLSVGTVVGAVLTLGFAVGVDVAFVDGGTSTATGTQAAKTDNDKIALATNENFVLLFIDTIFPSKLTLNN